MAAKTINIARASGKVLYPSSQTRNHLLRSSISVSELESLVRHRCLSGNNLDLHEALGFFNSLITIRPLPDIWSFNHLFGSLSKLGHYSTVVSMYRVVFGLGGFRPQVGTLTTVMNCLCRLQRVDLVFSVLATMLKLGVEPNAHSLSTLLRALCSQGSATMAAELLEEMVSENLPRNEFAYSAVVDGLSKSGDVDGALRLLRKAYGADRPRLDAVCFVPVIDALCKEGRVDDGLSLFAEMVGARVPPRVEAFNSLIHGLLRSGRWDEAERLFSDMRTRYEVSPNSRTYNIIIDSLCRDQRCDEAMRAFGSMLRSGLEPSQATFGPMLTSLCGSRRLDEAHRLFRSAAGFGVSLISGRLFSGVFAALCRGGRVEAALALMAEAGVGPDLFTYTALIQGLFRSNRAGDGFSVLAAMVKSGVEPDEVVLETLHGRAPAGRSERDSNAELRRLCRAGRWAEAVRVAEEVGFWPEERTLDAVVESLCRKVDAREAVPLLRSVAGGADAAAASLCSVLSALTHRRRHGSPEKFTAAAESLMRRRRIREALEVLKEMVENGVVPDGQARKLLRRTLARK